jgi:hypothetical protein
MEPCCVSVVTVPNTDLFCRASLRAELHFSDAAARETALEQHACGEACPAPLSLDACTVICTSAVQNPRLVKATLLSDQYHAILLLPPHPFEHLLIPLNPPSEGMAKGGSQSRRVRQR